MAKISADIYVDENLYEISNNLISIRYSGQDRSDTSLPSWGIKSNSGSLEMYDTDGTIERLSNQGLLANSEIKIYLNIDNRKEQIGGFYVVGASKDRQTTKTKIEFQDVLMSWNQKQLSGYYYLYYPRTVYAKDILDAIMQKAGQTLRYADIQTQLHLGNILIPIPTLSSGSLWALANKVCEVSACYIFCDSDRIPTIHYGGGT